MSTLYILCGISGSGKTTWAHEFINKHSEEDIRYVSRDEIRFSLLKDDEDYFAHEKEVYEKFVGTITQTLIDGFDIIADATHLNKFSRKKLTDAIDNIFSNYEIKYVVFKTPVNTCCERNAHREGRARVDNSVIIGMRRSFKEPTIYEDPRATEIITIDDNNDFSYLMEPYRFWRNNINEEEAKEQEQFADFYTSIPELVIRHKTQESYLPLKFLTNEQQEGR